MPQNTDVAIRYDPADDSSASYAGVGGDSSLDPGLVRDAGIELLVFAALGACFTLQRFSRLWVTRRCDPLPGTIQVAVVLEAWTRSRLVRAAIDGLPAEEWYVLRWQCATAKSGPFRIHERRGWRVLESTDGRLVWPASRSQPVLEAGTLTVPEVADDVPPAAAVRLLLALYIQTLALTVALPKLVHRPPDVTSRWAWWRFGPAPRAAIRFVVEGRLRKRLRALSDGLTRAQLGPGGACDVTFREAVKATHDACEELAGSLSRGRRLWRAGAGAVSVTVASLEFYPAYFTVPRINILGHSVLPALHPLSVLLLLAAALPVVIAQRTLSCGRALLASQATRDGGAETGGVSLEMLEAPVAEAEREAFATLGMPAPGDPSRRLGRGLWTAYGALFLAVSLANSGAGATLKLVADVLVLAAILYGVRRWLFNGSAVTPGAAPRR